MKIKAVIFDLDGTLTEPMLDFNQIRQEIGLNAASGDILSAIGAMDTAQRRQAHAILERHEQHAAQHSRLNDGVTELLTELRKRKLPIGLLTRNTRRNTMFVARRHRLDFDAVVDRDDGPVKPDGYGVLKLCEQFDAVPAETLVVGDFLHDLLSAKNAGAIAVLLKTHPQAEKFEIHADYVISQIGELINVIGKLEKESE
ncbi:MAG: HAD family hydrolase [Planctomycetota bacterium]|jgi:HAD superfamily hydrolase (TIGR01509 family)